MILGEVDTSVPAVNATRRKKISSNLEDANNTMKQRDTMGGYRTPHAPGVARTPAARQDQPPSVWREKSRHVQKDRNRNYVEYVLRR